MVKGILFFVIMGFCQLASAQFTATVRWQPVDPSNNGDTIYYSSDRKLNWPDFQGKPDNESPAAAITESGFGFKLNMESYGNKMNVEIIVFCYFNKKRSWVKKGMDNDYALTHEQHHFDITYINTCRFIEKLRKAPLNKGNFNYLVDKIHDECFTAMDKMQDEYDGQTANGRIERIQRLWNKKINEILEKTVTR